MLRVLGDLLEIGEQQRLIKANWDQTYNLYITLAKSQKYVID